MPPSNAMSMRTRSFLATAHQLREHAARRIRMHERDLEPEGAAARRVVDQLRAVAREALELRAHVVDLECDVVHSRPARGEELPDRRLGPERAEPLDAPVANGHRDRLDTLLGDGLAMLELRAERPPIAIDRIVEVRDGDAEVVDARGRHWPRC